MKKSTRVFILLAVIEVLIILGAIFMVKQITSGAWKTFNEAEAVSRIMTIAGAAIPFVAFILVMLALSLRKKGM